MPVVRISRGSFKPEDYERIKVRLDESEQTLVPTIRTLGGCLHYWAGIDPTTNTMVNVSVWECACRCKRDGDAGPHAGFGRRVRQAGRRL